jgi:hypothetical protein
MELFLLTKRHIWIYLYCKREYLEFTFDLLIILGIPQITHNIYARSFYEEKFIFANNHSGC